MKVDPPVDAEGVMLVAEDWAEIRRLHWSVGGDADQGDRAADGVGRNTVRRALDSDGPPRYQPPPRGSLVDAVELQIRSCCGRGRGYRDTVDIHALRQRRDPTTSTSRCGTASSPHSPRCSSWSSRASAAGA